MKNSISYIIGLVLIVAIMITAGAVYIVDETEQVVLTQFGEPIGEPITEAGLYFKIPFIQTINKFEKRILRWDGAPDQIPTLELQSIWVDTTARWRIVDALKFMQSVSTESIAQTRLDDVIESATRDAISNFNLVEAVRNSNELLERRKANAKVRTVDDFDKSEIKDIKVGREKITSDILERASLIVPKYGIELVDVRIKRLTFIEPDRKSAYARMIEEREAAAEKYLSEGEGEKARIEGQRKRELASIQSEAYRKAQEIKGRADAEATRIYADAYNRDPEFYSFIKSLESYVKTVDKDTTLILSTDSEFYKYFQDKGPISGQ